jgi:preprotein translocase SecE subunit
MAKEEKKKKKAKSKAEKIVKKQGKRFSKAKNGIGSLFTGVFNYFKLSYQELKGVTWLSRKDTVKFSVYVLIFIAASAISIGLADLGLFRLIGFITTT